MGGIETQSSAVFHIVAESIDLVSSNARKGSDIYPKLSRAESASSCGREKAKMLNGIKFVEEVVAGIGGIDDTQSITNL